MVKMRKRRPVRLWQVAAIAIVIVGTTGVTLGVRSWYDVNKERNRTELQSSADQIAVITQTTLKGYADQIASAVALFSQPGLFNRAAFHSYVASLDLFDRYTGIYGLGLVSWVPAAGLPGFEAGWRANGDPTFSVLPAGNRPVYCLVSQLEQKDLKSPVPVVGYDLCTVPQLAAALSAATISGKVQGLAESTLAPGPAYRGNFLMVAPVYSGDPTTAAERAAERTGWVAALVDGGQLLRAALAPARSHLAVELFAGSGVSPQRLVVSSPSGLEPGAKGAVIEHLSDNGIWTLRLRPLPGAPGPPNPLVAPLVVFVLGVAFDLALAGLVWDLGSGRLRARRSFLESEQRFQSLASSSPVGILELARDGTAQYSNLRLKEIAGIDDRFLRDRDWFECVHPDDRAALLAVSRTAWQTTDDVGLDIRLVRPSGEVRNVRVLAAPVTVGTDAPASFVATVQDVTEEVAATQALAFQAMHDSLTELPNRALFLDRLGVELGRAARSGTDLAVMFLDLDRFKVINDGLGHQAGDELLKMVAARLRSVVRAGETVARLGGDEFTFIFHDVAGAGAAAAFAERILAALAEPMEIRGREVVVTGSIGIVLPGPGAQAADVLRDADASMYRAKESGRARYEIFDAEQRGAIDGRLTIEGELRRGIERGELRLHYQPLVSLSTGRLLGAEALVRWHHPTRGILAPEEFVPVAEETGLIVALGAWAFRTAAADCARWDADDGGPDLEMLAINVSARQLASPLLCPMVHEALRVDGVEPGRISIEITESVIMSDDEVTQRSLIDLRNLGVVVAIDDFGTGYSSLASLSTLPVSVIKIDKSFVDKIDTEPGAGPIVVAIVDMAHALGLQVVAEGVTRQSQRQCLVECGCDVGQGYLWSEALPAEDFSHWWNAWVAHAGEPHDAPASLQRLRV